MFIDNSTIELLELFDRKPKYFRPGAKLQGENFSERDWSGYTLCKVFLDGANLEGTILSESQLTEASLKGANLRKACLEMADLKGALLQGADLREANLRGASLNNANLAGADLRGVDLSNTQLNGAILRGAELDGAKIPSDAVISVEGVVCLNKGFNNQGIPRKPNSPNSRIHLWKGLRFRSATEVEVAKALDNAGIPYLPNCLVRIDDSTTLEGRSNKELDFLVYYQGNWGILEVDGFWHPPERRVDEQKRERVFRLKGIRVYERYEDTRCYNEPESVVEEFLQIMSNSYS